MPVYEPQKTSWKWWQILAASCGGIILILACTIIIGSIYLTRQISRHVSGIMSGTPPKKNSTPYTISSGSGFSECSLILPSGFNKLTYYYSLPNPYGKWGERSIKITDKSGKSQEWPLPQCKIKNLKVGIYWYEAKNGVGPFIRFYDPGESAVLDLKKREVGGLFKIKSSYVVADYAYNDTSFYWCTRITDSSGNLSITDAHGNPARNVSSVINSANSTYLGTIVIYGNKLVLINNQTSTAKGH